MNLSSLITFGHRCEKTCLRRFTNNNGTDQPVHLRILISAFVIRLSEGIISKHALSEISIFYLVSAAKETGLSLTLSETQKTGFVRQWPISCHISFSLSLICQELLSTGRYIYSMNE